MSAKKKNSKKSDQVNRPTDKKPRGDTTVLGLSPRKLGSAVAAAVIAEVSQVAIKKISQSAAQSSSKETLNPINHSVKAVVDGVKEAIPEGITSQVADAVSPASEASDMVESALSNGQLAAAAGVDQGVENVKETAAVMAGIAQERAGDLANGTRQKADQTRDFVVAQIENAIAGAQDSAGKAHQALGNTLDATQDTASATQKAIAQVIDEAVRQVKALLANGLASSQKSGKPGKKAEKRKKAKKQKKGK